MAEGGYSQHPSSQTDEGGEVRLQVGNSGLPHVLKQHQQQQLQQHTSPHHVSHTSSHSSQGSHPHPHHTLVHGSPVRGSGSGADAPLAGSPARQQQQQQHHPVISKPQLQTQQGTGAGSSSSLSWSNIPLAVNNGDSRNSLDDEGQSVHSCRVSVLLRESERERERGGEREGGRGRGRGEGR